jgi:hypothetical protein
MKRCSTLLLTIITENILHIQVQLVSFSFHFQLSEHYSPQSDLTLQEKNNMFLHTMKKHLQKFLVIENITFIGLHKI